MSFKDSSWMARKDKLGDEAEGMFMQWAERQDIKYERFGFDHSELYVQGFPRRIRYRPDFITNGGLYECIGCGSDQKLKLAIYKWNCLQWWESIYPVQLYCWNRTKQAETILHLSSLDELIDELKVGLGSFPEKKAYWSIPCKELDWDEVPVDQATG